MEWRPNDQARALGEAGRASVSELQRWIGLRIRLPTPDGVVPIADTWEVRREDRGRDVLAPEAYHVLGGETTAAAAADPPDTPECGNAVDALVVLGERRGRRLRICPRRSRCKTHWGNFLSRRRLQKERNKKYAAEQKSYLLQQDRQNAARDKWNEQIMPAIAAAVAGGTWEVDDMLRVVLEDLRLRCGELDPPAGMEPLHECTWRTILNMSYWERARVVAAARVLGLDLGDDGVLAEAPGSRTQPPRASGERPILKTGRATGPRSLPRRLLSRRIRLAGASRTTAAGIAHTPARKRARVRCDGSGLPGGASWGMTGLCPASDRDRRLAFEQAHFSRARPLLRLLGSELDALAFAEELEHCAAHCAAVKEVLDAALVADEPETLVNQQTCDGAARHAVPPRERTSNRTGGHRAPLRRLHPRHRSADPPGNRATSTTSTRMRKWKR